MKNLKNLGQALSKAEQKEVNGGKRQVPCSQVNALCDWINPTSWSDFEYCVALQGC